jgi:hypothetical protein
MNDERDPILGLLARLPPAAPSAARVELARARSLVELEKRHRKLAPSQNRKVRGRVLDGMLYLACALYIAAAAIEALKLGWPLR